MVSKLRAERIADRMRQELSQIILMEVSDPRLAGVNVTDVTVDRELTIANVYVSSLQGSESAREILKALGHARGYLRSQLAARMDLRTYPQLRFNWDPTPENADRMEKLFAQIREETQEHEPDREEDNGAIDADEQTE
jgi:ribosome-binding factor A